MKRNLRISAYTLFAAMMLCSLLPASARRVDEGAGRVIEVTADKDNTFKIPGQQKPVMTVKPGEKIVLRITSHFGG